MTEKSLRKINTIIVLLLGIGLLLFVLMRTMFPKYVYLMNEADEYGISINKNVTS